jgi:FkbM family methyltransferase
MELKTVSANNLFNIYCENDLEVHRAQSLNDKEPETVNWISNFFKDGDVFYDIGANIGIYSLLAKSKFKNLKIYSFEPFLKNFYRLNQNIELNQFDNIHTFPIALSNSNKVSYFYSKDVRSGASGGQIDANIDEHGKEFKIENKQSVLTFQLDDLINYFKIPFPNYIKIDVDGVEDQIIKGMQSTLKNSALKGLLIELNHDSKTSETLEQTMLSLNFTLENPFHLSENHSRKRRLNNPTNKAENLIFIKKS